MSCCHFSEPLTHLPSIMPINLIGVNILCTVKYLNIALSFLRTTDTCALKHWQPYIQAAWELPQQHQNFHSIIEQTKDKVNIIYCSMKYRPWYPYIVGPIFSTCSNGFLGLSLKVAWILKLLKTHRAVLVCPDAKFVQLEDIACVSTGWLIKMCQYIVYTSSML